MRIVQVESPYAGDVEANVAYARACLADCLRRGEAPFASHLLYTQPGVLRDDDPGERKLGIDAGLAFLHAAEATVVYVDRGTSRGMVYGIAAARAAGVPIEFRSLKGWKGWTKPVSQQRSHTMTRAKFVCQSVRKFKHWNQQEGKFLYEADFSAVVNNSDENKTFFEATPSGSVKLATYREDVFEPGREYFLDFTPVAQ